MQRKRPGQWHERFRLVGRTPEHHGLIASSQRLLISVQGTRDFSALPLEPELFPVGIGVHADVAGAIPAGHWWAKPDPLSDRSDNTKTVAAAAAATAEDAEIFTARRSKATPITPESQANY
ncbi:hypothetical protein [Thioalkalivibrio sp. ALJ1]|uniref:hypothetical protein n=1 Tax=Thioalkalivibrio sp. ALJ1 TaxID=1158144 RepID=UPI001FCB80AB|nr:hypothetical protein [Thioalkalivibrio sp. ALJ1]